MKRRLTIAGIVLLGVGLILIAASTAATGQATSVSIRPGTYLQLSPNGIGGDSLSASWSGGTPTTIVYIITGTPTCSSTPRGVVASGSGASGFLSATLSGGLAVDVFACSSGSPQGITFSYTDQGTTIADLIGGAVEVGGIVVLLMGILAKPKAVAPGPAMPPRPTLSGRSI